MIFSRMMFHVNRTRVTSLLLASSLVQYGSPLCLLTTTQLLNTYNIQIFRSRDKFVCFFVHLYTRILL
ncbi:hypothetical protein RRG08_009005 [Elysia crispata]|uniref:Uncharacterized protein n=1 Tax=Elysia crispata TaxID=231223 RepID=A0AAE1DCC2_9GAST|nr:hypothetical protein RRG08_009005 [Elysia crispata]